MSSGEVISAEMSETVSMCMLRAGAGLFGVDTTQICEVLGTTVPQPVPLAPDYIDGVIPYRGEVLTAVSFRALLGLERSLLANCVLILYEEDEEDRFGLVVDGVGGVVTAARSALEPNPSALDARNMALFAGTYRTQLGLMVRLDPQSLRPSQLAASGLFGNRRHTKNGDLNESTYRR